MNSEASEILEQYGLVSIFGHELVDGVSSDYIQKLSNRQCLFVGSKTGHTPAFVYFGNTLFDGENNHTRDKKGNLIIHEQVKTASPRFLVLIFKLDMKHILSIPVVSRRRSSSNRRSDNACNMLERFLLNAFDDNEQESIKQHFHNPPKNLYGAMFVGLTGKALPVIICGSLFQFFSSGTLIHYIATDYNMKYDKSLKSGHNKEENSKGKGLQAA